MRARRNRDAEVMVIPCGPRFAISGHELVDTFASVNTFHMSAGFFRKRSPHTNTRRGIIYIPMYPNARTLYSDLS